MPWLLVGVGRRAGIVASIPAETLIADLEASVDQGTRYEVERANWDGIVFLRESESLPEATSQQP